MTTLIADETPIALVTHRCNACEGLILPGTRYRRQRCAYAGDIWTYKTHDLCDALYWPLHREMGLFADEQLDPSTVRDAVGEFFAGLCRSVGAVAPAEVP